MKFSEMGLSKLLLDSLVALGFENPTPIQEQAIPLLLLGQDIIGQAQTGTGKTAAFGLPMLEAWLQAKNSKSGAHPAAHAPVSRRAFFDNTSSRHGGRNSNVASPSALVLVPTRELAVQVNASLQAMARNTGARVVPVYGGVAMYHQLRSFQYPVDVIVGTPGRILDHLNQGTLKLNHIRTLVLDEADHMLDMGFIRDVVKIVDLTPHTRQTSLFSATMPPEISRLSAKYLKNPTTVKVSEDHLTVDRIRQLFVRVEDHTRTGTLLAAIQTLKPSFSLVFCRTKHGARKLSKVLNANGVTSDALHGNLSQSQRERAMASFRAGEKSVLVATDLASRGIDVSRITHVFNYDMPHDPTAYVHRIGRTGRAGSEGTAVSFISGNPRPAIETISRATGAPIEELVLSPVQVVMPSFERSNGAEPRHPGSRHSESGRRAGSGERPYLSNRRYESGERPGRHSSGGREGGHSSHRGGRDSRPSHGSFQPGRTRHRQN
ncbi:MAG: DEAD/DEAH box helicase [Candidatus Micrarchaeota archaeon]